MSNSDCTQPRQLQYLFTFLPPKTGIRCDTEWSSKLISAFFLCENTSPSQNTLTHTHTHTHTQTPYVTAGSLNLTHTHTHTHTHILRYARELTPHTHTHTHHSV